MFPNYLSSSLFQLLPKRSAFWLHSLLTPAAYFSRPSEVNEERKTLYKQQEQQQENLKIKDLSIIMTEEVH